MKSMIRPDSLWSAKVGEWECVIDPGSEKYPFGYHVQGKIEGMGGPAQSFEEAKARIAEFLARKGLKLPRLQNRIPGLEI